MVAATRRAATCALMILMVVVGLGPAGAGAIAEASASHDAYARGFFGYVLEPRVLDGVDGVCDASDGRIEIAGVRAPTWSDVYRVTVTAHPGPSAADDPLDRCAGFVPVTDVCYVRGAPDAVLEGPCSVGTNLTFKAWPRAESHFHYTNPFGVRYDATGAAYTFVVCTNTNYQPWLGDGWCGAEGDS